MYIKWIGACLIVAGCCGCGCSIASAAKKEERLIRQLQRLLLFMESELEYRLTPLPELCAMTAEEASGVLRNIFQSLSVELRRQYAPSAASCMGEVLQQTARLPGRARKHLAYLGRSLGRFDLTGQLSGIRAVELACRDDLERLHTNWDVRLRSYRTLGICAGAALVILFI